jgi:hypothetical protein
MLSVIKYSMFLKMFGDTAAYNMFKALENDNSE